MTSSLTSGSSSSSSTFVATAAWARPVFLLFGDFLADIFDVDLQAPVFGRQFADILAGNAAGRRSLTPTQRPLLLQLGNVHVNRVQTTLLGPKLRDKLLVPSSLMDDQSFLVGSLFSNVHDVKFQESLLIGRGISLHGRS